MFKIYDGRDHFYQWDLEQRLIVEDASINEVHFCNKTDDCSLVCEVYEIDGLRVVNVPNILLQDSWTIRVYAYCTNYTKVQETFKVVGRSKPAEYVYTETEVLNYNTLLERVNKIDENIGEVVSEYLEENPIEVDLSDYATVDYVDEAVNNIDIPSIEGLATEKYVDDAISNIDVTGGVGASGTGAYAEVFNDYVNNVAGGQYSHAEGASTEAYGYAAHAEGNETATYAMGAHAEGGMTKAKGFYSHAEGIGTIASGNYQHTHGKYNIEDTENKFIHIVGNGTNDANRSNANTLDWDGNAWFAGNVYVGGTSMADAVMLGAGGSVDLTNYATKDYVDEALAAIVDGEAVSY